MREIRFKDKTSNSKIKREPLRIRSCFSYHNQVKKF